MKKNQNNTELATTFNPLLCFARRASQTPEEVFDMLQERMITMLGHSYYEHGINLINWSPDSSATFDEIEKISNWQNSSLILSVKDFDRLGECVGLSITEVLGYPNISEEQSNEIDKQLEQGTDPDGFSREDYKTNGFEPSSVFVILSSLDILDDMAIQMQELEKTAQVNSNS